MVKVDQRRRARTTRKLERNFSSLPSVVCNDFFNSYAHCLLNRPAQTSQGSSIGLLERSPTKGTIGSGGGGGAKRRRSRVRVSCQLSELERSSSARGATCGRRLLIRRKLTQVKEVEEEVDDEQEDDDEQVDWKTTQRGPLARLDRQDFGVFLQNNSGGGGAGAGRLAGCSRTTRAGRQQQHALGPTKAHIKLEYRTSSRANKQGERKGAADRSPRVSSSFARQPEFKCYELFCVHQSSLLVHRSQVFVEAERLARRLSRL